MLRFQELEQRDDLGGEQVLIVEQGGRLHDVHLDDIDQPMGLPECRQGLAAHAFLLEHPAIDAPDDRRVPLDPHVTRDVLRDLGVTADEAVAADRHELMDAHFLHDGDVGLDVHVAREHRVDADRDPITELAVVADVRPLEEVVVAADPVTPSSFSEPRWIVTRSPIVLWSPISTRVGDSR